MDFLSVEEVAKRWKISARSVRNYCSLGRVNGAILEKGEWRIPDGAVKPSRKARRRLLPKNVGQILKIEMESRMKGGLYHQVQIDLTYNSNHIEGSRLTHEQTRWIFETMTIGDIGGDVPINDIVETANHFRCIDTIISNFALRLTEPFIKRLHLQLKNGTSDSRKPWFATGDYKKLANSVNDVETAKPEDVHHEMIALLKWYESNPPSFERILDFHVRFETIHPFQDGNGRIGRLIMFKECLRAGILPFIIDDFLKRFYYRGLHEWPKIKEYLLDTCRTGQDRFAVLMHHYGHACP